MQPSESNVSETEEETMEEVKFGGDEDGEMMKKLSARIEEMYDILGDYPILLGPAIRNEPLEVRMEDFSYTVMVNPNTKVDTVFNSSFLYPLYKFYKRKFRGEDEGNIDLVPKTILDRVNLVFKPGKMYLVLGAPGSGELLRQCVYGD